MLCEAGLLRGALTRNSHLHFRNRDQVLTVERADTAWTSDYEAGQRILIPVKNGEGRYVAADQDLDRSRAKGGSPSATSTATRTAPVGTSPVDQRERPGGGSHAPHPEHAVEDLTGPGTDGLFFTPVLKAVVNA